MAVIFMDGFDHWDGWVGPKWTTGWTYGWTGAPNTYASGRYAVGRYWRSQGQTDWMRKTFTGNPDTVIVGMSWYPNWQSTCHVFGIGVAQAATHVYLNFNGSDRLLRVYNGDGTVIGTGTTVISYGIWYYLELKVLIANSGGTVQLKINGNTEFSLTGKDTANHASLYATDLWVGTNYGSNYGAGENRYDDLYLLDMSGSVNDFICPADGDVLVTSQMPNAVGSNSQWTKSAGSNNYECVDEAPANTTDMVSTFSVDQKDTYNVTDLVAASADIKTVGVHYYVYGSSRGAFDPLAILGGSERTGTRQYSPATTWVLKSQFWETDPATNAWTRANFNSCEFGMKSIVI